MNPSAQPSLLQKYLISSSQHKIRGKRKAVNIHPTIITHTKNRRKITTVQLGVVTQLGGGFEALPAPLHLTAKGKESSVDEKVLLQLEVLRKGCPATCLWALERLGLLVNVEVPLQVRVGDKGEATVVMRAGKGSLPGVGHGVPL